jgi:hypothetical protein
VGSAGYLGHGPPDARDEVQFGRRPAARRRLWLPGLLLAAAVTATAAAIVATQPGPHRKAGQPNVIVTFTVRPILGVNAGWELFARGPADLVAIQFARGRITRTAVPELQSGNPAVSFVVGPHEAIIRSFDFVPGCVVPDGAPARLLTGPLATGGPLLPGPNQSEAWQLASAPNGVSLVLLTLSGHQIGPAIVLQPTKLLAATATSDGRGDVLLLTNLGDEYDAGPNWFRPVHGQVIATGTGTWLVLSCPHHRCRNLVLDPVGGAERTLPGAPLRTAVYGWPPAGVISPAGQTAAVIDPGGAVRLINLGSGADTRLAVPADQDPANESMAWSPDGRWLFLADDGKLLAVNARTDRVTSLGIKLPYITQVAIRNEAG